MPKNGFTALSNRECLRLMKAWGFEEERNNGGHLVLVRGDRRVQMTGVKRKTNVPVVSLRKAAKIVGVSYQEFLAGPKQKAKT